MLLPPTPKKPPNNDSKNTTQKRRTTPTHRQTHRNSTPKTTTKNKNNPVNNDWNPETRARAHLAPSKIKLLSAVFVSLHFHGYIQLTCPNNVQGTRLSFSRGICMTGRNDIDPCQWILHTFLCDHISDTDRTVHKMCGMHRKNT